LEPVSLTIKTIKVSDGLDMLNVKMILNRSNIVWQWKQSRRN